MKAILIGAGGTSRELLRRLGENWDVTVVDPSGERLGLTEGLRPRGTVCGDGSSRVVLSRAGLDTADALVAATNDDEINLEACRLALEAHVSRLVAVAADPERLPDYRDAGVTAISADALAARRVELTLESRRVSSTAFAAGRAEVIEFRISHDSPVRGKALKELHARSWIIGAVLQRDKLIIPHGDTVLHADDRVTVVGAGADFADIVKTFTSGEGRFPLDFGKRVAVALDTETDAEGTLSEAVHLARHSRASSLIVVHRDPDAIHDDTRAARLRAVIERVPEVAEGVEVRDRSVRGRPSRLLPSLSGEESIGAIVVGVPHGRGPMALWKTHRAAMLARRTGRPVLLSRRSHPYRRVVVPARRTPTGRAAVRAAIDLARFAKGELYGIAVVDPFFISGPVAPVEAREAIAWLEEEAAVHGVPVEGAIHRGNPVKKLIEVGSLADLIVLGVPPGHLSTRLGIGRLVAIRAPRSVLLVPARESA